MGHRSGAGRVDESARRLSHEELAVAELLAGEGHLVRSLPERRGKGPVADLSVCGQAVEVKTWLVPDERNRPPSVRSVFNKLASARDQAPTVVLWAVGRAVTPAMVQAGLREFARRNHVGQIRDVRVVGDGFDLSWTRGRTVSRDPSSWGKSRPAPRAKPGFRLPDQRSHDPTIGLG